MAETIAHSMFLAGSIILALIGFVIVLRIWIRWKHIDKDVLKARVFLDKMFLEKNWIYVFLTGASIAVHQFLDFMILSNYIVNDWAEFLSQTLEFLGLLFLVILVYEWFKLLLPVTSSSR
jgi:hypothetical protein